ncbi:hypothetical protein BDW42DRAFT_171129 [Aspergillus taichungensis]|uniref:Mitochondrial respiratory complex I chaperone n=1 Tax=Aspergillus taichungensis TaxID=482145 RepID=A0A2J5HSG8_9EURO|nr:hypothetical protein BDW42DRAFT_171129 [Aspergillus taichungensis]
MQSHLTRGVFRAILNNEPLSSTRCRCRLLHTARNGRMRKLAFPHPQYTPRRSLFAFSAPPEAPAPTVLPSEKGLKPMRDLMRALSDKSRGPANGTLTKAFREFFVARAENVEVITGFHSRLLLTTWKYLRAHEEELEREEWQMMFSTENLENVLFVLSETECTDESRPVVLRLARFAFLELCANHGFGPNHISRPALLAYIGLQASQGNPDEARHVVEKFWPRLQKTCPSPWLTVMKGYAIANDKYHLKKMPEKFDEYGVQFDPASQEELIDVLINQGFLSGAQTIYECRLFHDQEPTLAAKQALIKHSIMRPDQEWARPVFESLRERPIAETIATLLLWEAASGKGLDAICATVEQWTAENPEVQSSLTTSCVNDLIEYANSIGNPQLATEFASLIPRWGLEPDTQTHVLQLDTLVQAGDVPGTMEFIVSLGDITSMAVDSANLPLMNRLLKMLCLSGQEDALFEQVSFILDPLFANNVRLDSETLAALTHMLLYRHDWEGVSELLRPRLGLYDSEERTRVRKALTNYIMDLNEDSKDVWDIYGLLRIAFPEMGVGIRSEIMSSFFNRGRADLAFLVFGHMRQAEEFSRRPKPDTYARCFQGIARTQDDTHLETVHNMLKLDVEVDLNTRILDSLMLAYAACDKPAKSMEIFREILQSDEGPSDKTIAIFFKMCEKHHNGAQEAMKMMKKVKVLEIPMDRRLYMAYVEALAAQCEFELATQALDRMQEEIGCLPTRNSIGLLYNAIPYQYWKDEVEKWAKVKYPEQWAQLAEVEGTDSEEDGYKFHIKDNPVYA